MSSWQVEVASRNPSAWWQQGDAGTTMVDSSGNGRNGTHAGATVASGPGLLPGDPNVASYYSGTGVTTVTSAVWMDTAQLGVAAWFRLPNVAGEHLIVARDNNGADLRWRLDTTGASLRAICNIAGSLRIVTTGAILSPTTDYVTFLTYDGVTIRLYLYTGGVGGQVGTLAIAGSILTGGSREIRLGNQSNGSAPMAGPIDEVVIFPSAANLSAADTAILAASTWVTPPDSPTGLTADPDTTSVDLAWVAPGAGGAPTSYEVRVDGGAPDDVGNVLAHTATGLTTDTEYLFEVRSIRNTVPSAWVPITASTLPDTSLPPPVSARTLRLYARLPEHYRDADTPGVTP